MITKNLLPKCIKGQDTQQAKPNSWAKMEKEEQFIDSIDTSGGEMSDAAKFNLLVSSVPSPWSRVHLTCHAIQSEMQQGDSRTLMQFYDFMRSEWRGLVAAYVLQPDYFKLTEPVELVSSDIADRKGRFDIISTYADMLFDDTSLWKYEKGGQDEPKMQLLYYQNGTERQLVGGTSPFTMFFTAMNYSVKQDEERIYWIKDGKFCDPLDTSFEIFFKKGESKYSDKHFDNLKKLYSFLTSVQTNRKEYLNDLEGIWDSEHQDDDLSATPGSRCAFVNDVLDKAIGQWMHDLEKILGKTVAEASTNLPVHHKRPTGPLGTLLSVKTVYYWWNNTFYTSAIDDPNVKRIDDVERVFIDSSDLAIWPDDAQTVTNSQGGRSSRKIMDYRYSPVYFLEVQENGKSWFLAVPLSNYALDEVFKEETTAIITGASDKVKLMAEKHGEKVDVYLKARIDGQGDFITIRNRTFNIKDSELNSQKHVFIWPNFCSEKWTKYYYYSEYPTNSPDVQMVPVFDGIDDVENPELQTKDKNVFSQLIKYPSNHTSGDHEYEVMRTNRPLRRIVIRKRMGSNLECLGVLIIRQQDSKPGIGEPQAMYRINKNLDEATVGFDFGSTNSCSYYKKDKQEDVKPVPFANHRLAIIGFDNNPGKTAKKNELLFISNEEPINHNGQIKSWLHEHDEKFTNPTFMDEELVGGVPVNETNITVKSMDAYEIMTNAGRLRYNMKWLVDDVGKRRKKAFMKMVWVHICADLFEEGVYPKTLNWSYPSAMGSSDMEALSDIFEGLPTPCPSYPVETKNSFTEAEAVCSYFLDKKIALKNNNMFLGIDIGGSTSDILILGRDNGGSQPIHVQPVAQPVVQSVQPQLPMGPYYMAVNGQQAGPYTGEQLQEMKNHGELTIETLLFKNGMATWTPAGQLPELAPIFASAIPPIPGVPPVPGSMVPPPIQTLPNVHFFVAVNGQPTKSALDAQQLLDLMNGGQLNQQTQVWTQGMAAWAPAGQVAELGFLFAAPAGMPPLNNMGGITPPPIGSTCVGGENAPRLFTQCSVRMAAGVFFDAIINSKKFRDCIRLFHDSKQTNIMVDGIGNMDKDPKMAPYYLNNIFDQLHGDEDFKKFYTSLRSEVPFVFTLPAYITGALMAYAGMLMRNTIIKQQLRDVKEIHVRYFGKGGRLFEWLFFAFRQEQVDAYLNACFEVGLKNEIINQTFGRDKDFEINCIFDNVSEPSFGHNENSENKSEVAHGLVSQLSIAGIEANRKILFGKRKANAPKEYDARKQEVIGEMNVLLRGKPVNELDIVDDNFYENEGAITMPDKFQNFSDFIEVFTQFIGHASSIYPNANQLEQRSSEVENVNSFIIRDSEYRKYIDNIRKGNEDSYRMPVFVASCLYYLQEVLLKEVFKN